MDCDPGQHREELQSLRRGWSAFTIRRLALWLLRWTIGFALIGLVTALLPGLSWLWWLGIGFALLTPLTAVVGQRLVSRKIRDTEAVLANLEEALQKGEKG